MVFVDGLSLEVDQAGCENFIASKEESFKSVIEDVEHIDNNNDYVDENEMIKNMNSKREENVEESKVDKIPSSRPVLSSRNFASSIISTTEEQDQEVDGNQISEDSSKSCMEETDSECKESILTAATNDECDHAYEIGVTVVKISHNYLHLVGPLGEQWLEAAVDPLVSLVYIDGMRTKEVYSVKNGSMGHMVVRKCLNCQQSPNMVLDSPSLVWFGVRQVPCVRGQEGVVVGVEGKRKVVQLESPPAARIPRLVLLHGDDLDSPPLQTKVKVWAWTRNIKRGVTDKFLEGAAIVTVSTEDHKSIEHTEDIASESDSDNHEQKVESSNTSTMSIKLQLQRLLLQRLQFLSFTPSA